MKHGIANVFNGFRPVIVKEGPKWSQVVFIDCASVRVRKIKGRVNCTDIPNYTLQKMARKLLRPRDCLGNKVAISKGARKLLKEAAA